MGKQISRNDVQRDEYRRFLGRFFACVLVLFAAACLLPPSCYEPLARLTAVQTNALLQFAGLKSLVHGEHIFVKGISAWIVPECTPVYMILVYAAFVVSFPATVRERVEGMMAGALFLTAANVVRLGLTIALGAVKPVWFSFIHAYIGQVWSVLSVLIACFVWVRRLQSARSQTGILRFAGGFAVASAMLFLMWMPWNEAYVRAGDAVLRRMFSWFDEQIFFSYGHSVYYHTFNFVVYGALILADGGLDRVRKIHALALGIPLLALMHLALRFFNVLFSGYGWTAFLPVATTVHLTSQLLLPIGIWLILGGGLSFRQTVMPSKGVRKHPAPTAMVTVAALIAMVAVPSAAFAGARLFDEKAIYRELNTAAAKTNVIVNLSDPGQVDLKRVTPRAMRRQNVRSMQERVLTGADQKRIRLKNRFNYHSGFSASVTRQGLEALMQHADVVSIEPDRVIQVHTNQGIALMNATSVRTTYNGQGVAIAIVDTGIQYTHPTMVWWGDKVLGGYDFGDNDAAPMDANGHGTSVAGIAAGNTGTVGDYIGGVAPGAKLYAVKVSPGTSGGAYTSDIIAGWEWCITHQYDNPDYPILVINTSMGGGKFYAECDSYSTSMTNAAANATEAGITIFASSGNDGYCNAIAWPSCISHVISVGAVFDASLGTLGFCVDSSSCASNMQTYSSCGTTKVAWSYSITADREAPYSNTSPTLGLFAPSHHAYTPAYQDTYNKTFGGTSAASPYAAGAAAVLQQAAKAKLGTYLTPDQVRSILTGTGDAITDVKADYGKRRINLQAAVDALTAEPVPALSSAGFTVLLVFLGVLASWLFRYGKTRK